MEQIWNRNSVEALVAHQIQNYWPVFDKVKLHENIKIALDKVNDGFKDIPSNRFSNAGEGVFNPLMSVHWAVFLYKLSNIIYKNRGGI